MRRVSEEEWKVSNIFVSRVWQREGGVDASQDQRLRHTVGYQKLFSKKFRSRSRTTQTLRKLGLAVQDTRRHVCNGHGLVRQAVSVGIIIETAISSVHDQFQTHKLVYALQPVPRALGRQANSQTAWMVQTPPTKRKLQSQPGNRQIVGMYIELGFNSPS